MIKLYKICLGCYLSNLVKMKEWKLGFPSEIDVMVLNRNCFDDVPFSLQYSQDTYGLFISVTSKWLVVVGNKILRSCSRLAMLFKKVSQI